MLDKCCGTCKYISVIPRVVHIPKSTIVYDCKMLGKNCVEKTFRFCSVCDQWRPKVDIDPQMSIFELLEKGDHL